MIHGLWNDDLECVVRAVVVELAFSLSTVVGERERARESASERACVRERARERERG